MGAGLRYFGGAVAFGFAAVWIMQSLAAALVCLLAAAVGYAGVLAAQSARAKLAVRATDPARPLPRKAIPESRTAEVTELGRRADELNDDLGHIYQPSATTPSSGAVDPDESPLDET